MTRDSKRSFSSKVLAERAANAWAGLIGTAERTGSGLYPSETPQTSISGVPMVWMLGKVQSGKSSIVKAITGCSDIDIGSGFEPCTPTSRSFDYPGDMPLIRFLDTRGLGEIDYDPSVDLAVFEARAHAVLVTMRAMDTNQDAVVRAVTDLRMRRPDWPVVVVQTCLHEALPVGSQHPQPYPFDHARDAIEPSAGSRVPDALRRSLAYQRGLFGHLAGSAPVYFVPIDFTPDDDGFDDPLYGKDALISTIGLAAPVALAATLRSLRASTLGQLDRDVHTRIVQHASAAATIDAFPVAGLVGVPAVQGRLLKSLGDLYGFEWDRRLLSEFAGCLGVGVLSRLLAGLGVRQVVKLVPGYGQTIGAATAAATSFATTYALGKAAAYYLSHRKLASFDTSDVAQAYGDALRGALQMASSKPCSDAVKRPNASVSKSERSGAGNAHAAR